MWFKKEPIKTEEVKGNVDEILAKVYEFHPDRKYVIWFEQMLNSAHIDVLRQNMERLVGHNQVSFVCGLKRPEIYEFEESSVALTKVIAKPLTGESQ